jgi:hypothetical protein
MLKEKMHQPEEIEARHRAKGLAIKQQRGDDCREEEKKQAESLLGGVDEDELD